MDSVSLWVLISRKGQRWEDLWGADGVAREREETQSGGMERKGQSPAPLATAWLPNWTSCFHFPASLSSAQKCLLTVRPPFSHREGTQVCPGNARPCTPTFHPCPLLTSLPISLPPSSLQTPRCSFCLDRSSHLLTLPSVPSSSVPP